MPLLTSIMEALVSDPYARVCMRDTILEYIVPDHKPIYDAVVREIKWLGHDISEDKITAMLEALDMDAEDEDFYKYLPPKSYFWEYENVLRQIDNNTCGNLRFFEYFRRMNRQ